MNRKNVQISSNNDLFNALQGIIDKPYLCDVTFLVGEAKKKVYGVRVIIAARSR